MCWRIAAGIGDWTRMRQWALAAGTALAGFALLCALGGVDAALEF